MLCLYMHVFMHASIRRELGAQSRECACLVGGSWEFREDDSPHSAPRPSQSRVLGADIVRAWRVHMRVCILHQVHA